MLETAVTAPTEPLTLKINEVFYSIQGEGRYALYPCVFIRLSSCNLRCVWCDTTYSFYEGTNQNISDLVQQIKQYPSNLVEITGGEPLLQKNVYALFSTLHSMGKKILLETSGSIRIDKVPNYVHVILDMKAPGSGENSKNDLSNLALLKSSDDLKIVVASDADFAFAENLIHEHALGERLENPVIIQPAFGILEPAEVGEWVKSSRLNLRLGMQLHKYIYEPTLRAV